MVQETPSISSNAKDRVFNLIPDKNLFVAAVTLTLAVRAYLFWNYYTINNDGVLYIEAARHFWNGNWFGGLESFHPPLFPLMIAVAFPMTGEWESAGQFWPLILGVLIIFPLFSLLQRFYGQKVALIALFFYSVSPNLTRLSIHARSEIPYIFFLVLALYFLQRAIDRERHFPLFFIAGITSALAYLVRPEGVGLAIVGAFYLLYRGWKQGVLKRGCLQIGIFFLGFVLLSAPYGLYLKWDTGNWIISRKAANVLSIALADHDPSVKEVSQKDSGKTSAIGLIASRPSLYLKKVFIDAFRSLVVYFEALHYSYLPFLLLGCFFCLCGPFWERDDFLFFALIVFYLAAFALLYVNRRFAVPLVPLSLGWIGAGYLAFHDFACQKWQRKGSVITGVVVSLFLGATLPWTLKAIGRDKFYLREAGIYLKGIPGDPSILTTNGRVAFYAKGQNHVLIDGLISGGDLSSTHERDLLALDEKVFYRVKDSLIAQGWLLDQEFSETGRKSLFILRRVRG